METQTQENSQTQSSSEPHTPVRLSDKAAAMVKETIERENLQGSGLRVAGVGGGCSGFQYSLDIEKDERPGDMVFESSGVKFFVYALRWIDLMGVEIECGDGPCRPTGVTFQGPTAQHACG